MSTLNILHQVPLHDKNWFATGGPARYFCQPKNPLEFQHAVQFARHNNLATFILGQGANILIHDAGFNGLIINPQLKNISIVQQDERYALVSADAGVSLDDLIGYCLDHNMQGLEEFSGIPSSVGGATYINLHYFEFLLSDFLVSAQVINKETGAMEQVSKEWFNFGYNTSTLLNGTHYLAQATFLLARKNDLEIAYAHGRRTEIIRHRIKKYPSAKTCGSFFRNFYPHELQQDQIPYIAYYLDKIGVKGSLSWGGAAVSHQHANMIVNVNNATSHDIIMVARTMQQLVKDQFNLRAQPECQLIGFETYPLYP